MGEVCAEKRRVQSLLQRRAVLTTMFGCLALAPTLFRFDRVTDLGTILCLLLAVLLSLAYFGLLLLKGLLRRELRAVGIAILGLELAVLPATYAGFTAAQYSYFLRMHGSYREQVELAKNGKPTAVDVAGARVDVRRDPFGVLFYRNARLSGAIGILFSPSGRVESHMFIEERLKHLWGDWYWCEGY